MPVKFKTSIKNLAPLERAARKRVLDGEVRDFTEKQIQVRINQFLKTQNRKTLPSLSSGEVLLSSEHRDFLKDSKFFIHLNNAQLSELYKEIYNTSNEGFGILADIQQEANALNSQISEEEIKLLGTFDVVHFNNFVRQHDMGLSWEQKDWLYDYKTEVAFLVDHMAEVIPNTGVSLPIRENIHVPIVDAQLIGEDTDVGDSRHPIVKNNPRNVFLPDRVWRYVIIRREHNKTSRKFSYQASKAALQLELPNLQLINYINIKPICQRGLVVDELAYVNESGETVSLDTLQVDIETNQILLFEPIRTRYLKLKLKAYAPVSKTEYNVRGWSKKELNDILRGTGWTMLLPEDEELIQGRIFDFSLEHVSVGLNIYEPLGVFRSKSVKVNSPAGVAISDRAASIQVTNEQRAYGVDFALPDGVVLNEYYLGITLKTPGGKIAMRDLVPIPDSYPVQREFLPIIGAEAKVKLFPDMLWTLEKAKVASIVHGVETVDLNIVVTTEEPHGFLEGDEITLLSGPEWIGNGTYTIYDVEDFVFKIRVSSLIDEQLVDAGTVPRVIAYKKTDTEDPFVVNLEDEQLTIGVDYHISLDGGSTWLSDFPRDTEYSRALIDRQAGNFKIKFLVPVYDRLYWIEYRPLKNQYLSKDRKVRLRHGRVIFDESLQDTSGTINTVIVSRADSSNPYVTPVVIFYALKVREHVS